MHADAVQVGSGLRSPFVGRPASRTHVCTPMCLGRSCCNAPIIMGRFTSISKCKFVGFFFALVSNLWPLDLSVSYYNQIVPSKWLRPNENLKLDSIPLKSTVCIWESRPPVLLGVMMATRLRRALSFCATEFSTENQSHPLHGSLNLSCCVPTIIFGKYLNTGSIKFASCVAF